MPKNWTDNAEFIWSLAGLGKTQAEIAEIRWWSREGVKDYSGLKNSWPDT